jgi:hypothetical protein
MEKLIGLEGCSFIEQIFSQCRIGLHGYLERFCMMAAADIAFRCCFHGIDFEEKW